MIKNKMVKPQGNNCKNAFTLAEVLITLGVIGVVAAISLPRFIDNMTQRANSERHANIAQKVTSAMEQMRAHGLLNTPYPTTEAFVDELQNYLKIAKRCDKDHIADCWPTEKVTAGDGKEYNISLIHNGKYLQLSTDTNNVGLVLADGGAIILNYNPETNTLDIGDSVTSSTKSLPVGNTDKKFPYTSSVTDSIDFIMDVNGEKGPNSETINNKWHDVRSFKFAKIKGCDLQIPNIGCIIIIEQNYSCINTCNDTTWDNSVSGFCNNNCWAGARKACESIGMKLPQSIWTLKPIYNVKNNYSELSSLNGRYWTMDVKSNNDVDNVSFDDGSTGKSWGKNNKHGALCVK